MAKVTAPLLSIGARGQIGKSQVYGTWRGVKTVRQHVVPSNPRTTAQLLTRDTFAALDELWKRMGPLSRATWVAEIARRPLTARNALFRANIPPLRGAADMTGWIGSQGAGAGLPPVAVTAVGGTLSGEIDVTITSSSEPAGWTLDAVVAHAIRDRDPTALPTEFVVEGEDVAPVVDGDTTITLSGLAAGQGYVLAGWTRWLRPDGQTAYGSSISTAVVNATV